MEPKITNLYRINVHGWSKPAYAAADSQQEAIEKVAADCSENKFHFNVEFISEIYL